MPFAILSDTSGNLPVNLPEKLGISIIPFIYRMDETDHVCMDIENFDGETFYRDMKAGKQVTTIQIPPQKFMDFFEPFLKKGEDVIFISMSSGISGSCNSAEIAGRMLKERYPEHSVAVIDTKGAALGEGLVALRGAELRAKGLSFSETVEALEKMSHRMCNVFTVDDLMFLRRGGRLSNLAAIMGTVLNVKPLLKGDEEGKIVVFAKLRGRRRAIEALAERYDSLCVCPEKQTVGIVHAACREDAELLSKLLYRNRPPKSVLLVGYEPVTGCHVGPGALALFFEGSDTVRTDLNNISNVLSVVKTKIDSVRNALNK